VHQLFVGFSTTGCVYSRYTMHIIHVPCPGCL
jgi:hypothetical protein